MRGTRWTFGCVASCLNPRPGFHRPVVEVLWPRQHPTPLPTSVVWSEFVRGVGNFFYKSTSTLPLAMLRFAWFCFALPGFAFVLLCLALLFVWLCLALLFVLLSFLFSEVQSLPGRPIQHYQNLRVPEVYQSHRGYQDGRDLTSSESWASRSLLGRL